MASVGWLLREAAEGGRRMERRGSGGGERVREQRVAVGDGRGVSGQGGARRQRGGGGDGGGGGRDVDDAAVGRLGCGVGARRERGRVAGGVGHGDWRVDAGRGGGGGERDGAGWQLGVRGERVGVGHGGGVRRVGRDGRERDGGGDGRGAGGQREPGGVVRCGGRVGRGWDSERGCGLARSGVGGCGGWMEGRMVQRRGSGRVVGQRWDGVEVCDVGGGAVEPGPVGQRGPDGERGSECGGQRVRGGILRPGWADGGVEHGAERGRIRRGGDCGRGRAGRRGPLGGSATWWERERGDVVGVGQRSLVQSVVRGVRAELAGGGDGGGSGGAERDGGHVVRRCGGGEARAW